jgi:uncharacterized membrane protein
MMLTRYWLFSVAIAVSVFCGGRTWGAAGDDALADKVLVVFKAKCFACHTAGAKDDDPQAKKGKRKLDCVDNLSALRANLKWVVPGDVSKSEVYKQVQSGDMPPDDNEMNIAALSDGEKDVVKQWVLAGAPVGKQVVLATTVPARPQRAFRARLIEFIGKFHPLAAHTPIAVLMAAAIAEMLYLRHPAPALTGASRFCMVLGALGAIATAALGWAMATAPSISKTAELDTHRWAGTIAALACIPIAVLGEWGARRAHKEGRKWHGFSRWAFRIAVFGIAGMVGFTAHLGGLLVWGPHLFDFPK